MEPPQPSAHVLRATLDRVLASAAFRSANRSSTLLRFIVTSALDGRAQYLKEYTLGAEALDRGERFDPRIDPIVRVEMSRLRGRLELYYAKEGAGDDVVITLPKGTYVPHFVTRSTAAAQPRPRLDATPARPPSRGRDALWLAGGGALAALFAFWYSLSAAILEPPPTAATLRADIALGAPGTLAIQVGNSLALSRDGSVLTFVARAADGSTHLFVRRLDELSALELEGTAGAHSPFFSPDGRWLGFYADGRVKKVLTAAGGSPITLAEAADFAGASWGDDGFIVARLDRSASLSRIPESGGTPTALPALDGKLASLRWPQLLPDGRTVLGTTSSAGGTAIAVARLDGSEQREVIRQDCGAATSRAVTSSTSIAELCSRSRSISNSCRAAAYRFGFSTTSLTTRSSASHSSTSQLTERWSICAIPPQAFSRFVGSMAAAQRVRSSQSPLVTKGRGCPPMDVGSHTACSKMPIQTSGRSIS